MKMQVRFKSLSTESRSTDAFISVLLILVLRLNEYDVKSFTAEFKTWVGLSSEFTKAFGLAKTFTKIVNSFMLKGSFSEELALELGKVLKDKKAMFERDTTVTHGQLSLINDIGLNLRTASESAWNRIHKNVSILRNPKLSSIFVLDDEQHVGGGETDLKAAAKALPAVIQKAVGRSGHFLTPDEAQKLRLDNPELFSKYAKLVKVVNAAVKRETFNYVRSTGKPMVGVEDLRSYLNKKGIPNNLPTGFVGGQFDEFGKAYTREGRLIDRIPIGIVKMNPKYNPDEENTYVMRGVDHRVTYRTTSFTQSLKEERHSLVKEFLEEESKYRAMWLKDLDKKGSKDQLLAAMVELIYATSARIGGVGNESKGEPTYGMSTLQVSHLKLKPNLIAFDYVGKKNAPQPAKYQVKDHVSKRVLSIVEKLVADKKPSENVWTYKGKPINRAMVNTYLKSKGIKLSIHRFRQLAGTKLAMMLMSKAPFKKSDHPKQSEVEKWFKEEMKKVGELLHHRNGENVTGMTAVKSYISPEEVVSFFTRVGLRKPKFLK